jgi:hypothetical protein
MPFRGAHKTDGEAERCENFDAISPRPLSEGAASGLRGSMRR